MDLEKKKYLLGLVEKLQEGSATKEEVKTLIDFYITFQQSEDWPLDIESKQIIKESIFKNIQTGIHATAGKKVKVVSLLNRDIVKYAIAACLILAACIIVFKNSTTQNTHTPVLVNTIIKAGTDKAVLTLEDGTSIPLEKNNS